MKYPYNHYVFTDDIMSLFGIKVFSEAGTNQLKMEQATYIMFQDLLEELEGMHIQPQLYLSEFYNE